MYNQKKKNNIFFAMLLSEIRRIYYKNKKFTITNLYETCNFKDVADCFMFITDGYLLTRNKLDRWIKRLYKKKFLKRTKTLPKKKHFYFINNNKKRKIDELITDLLIYKLTKTNNKDNYND